MSADTPVGTAFTYIGDVNFLPLSEITYSTNFFLNAYYMPAPVLGTGDTRTSHCWTLPTELELSWGK